MQWTACERAYRVGNFLIIQSYRHASGLGPFDIRVVLAGLRRRSRRKSDIHGWPGQLTEHPKMQSVVLAWNSTDVAGTIVGSNSGSSAVGGNMTLRGLTREKNLRRILSLVGLLLVLSFLSHGVTMATDSHRSDVALPAHSSTSHSEIVNDATTGDAAERPCDVDRKVSLAPGQSRPEPLMTTDAISSYPPSSANTGPAEPSSAPPLSAALLRALLQVFLI